jgi:hypothetical protein
MSFIYNYFEVFYIVLTTDYHEKFKIESKVPEGRQLLENFIKYYTELVKYQEEKSKYILDFSSIFNYIVDEINEFENLIKIKSLYKKELSCIKNKYFEQKIEEKIHFSGIKLIEKGDYNNLFLIAFIKNDNEYKKTEKEKFNILKYFKVDLMDDNFFNEFNKNKIFSFFEQNLSQYLKCFSEIIK